MRRNPSQNAAFFTKSEHTKAVQFPRSTLGTPGCFPVFRDIYLKTPSSFGMLFTRCSDEVSRQISKFTASKQPQQPR